MKVVFLACSNHKLARSAQAKDLYSSPLFRLSWQYANKLKSDRIFILSAKYGLIEPDQIIKPYNLSLNTMSSQKIQEWANRVNRQLKAKDINFASDRAIFLAGARYRRHLAPLFTSYKVPMEGLSIGKQLRYLKKHV